MDLPNSGRFTQQVAPVQYSGSPHAMFLDSFARVNVFLQPTKMETLHFISKAI